MALHRELRYLTDNCAVSLDKYSRDEIQDVAHLFSRTVR